MLASSYHPQAGGVEEHVRNVARELTGHGHQVVVWTVDRGEHLGARDVEGIGVRYLQAPLPRLSPAGVIAFLRALPGAWSGWSRALREFRPEILHVHCFGPNGVYALALHRRFRIPVVLSAHGETFMDIETFRSSRLLRWSLARAVRNAAVVTGCSHMVLEDLRARFGLRGSGVVVPNGVDMAEPERLGVEMTPHVVPTVFAVGRLVPVKGFDLLVRAFALAELPPGARLVIGGDGPEERALALHAAELGVGERVEFVGRLDRAGVIRGMAAADVVVVPSRVEAFGIVILEAWRAGTALIATSRGGPADLVTDGVDGLLVDPHDVDALARALSRVLGDPTFRDRLSTAGRATVAEYTWERTARLYEDVYSRILGGGGHA